MVVCVCGEGTESMEKRGCREGEELQVEGRYQGQKDVMPS